MNQQVNKFFFIIRISFDLLFLEIPTTDAFTTKVHPSGCKFPNGDLIGPNKKGKYELTCKDGYKLEDPSANIAKCKSGVLTVTNSCKPLFTTTITTTTTSTTTSTSTSAATTILATTIELISTVFTTSKGKFPEVYVFQKKTKLLNDF